jgi:peptidoglycan hydrolase CwlO-like protein
MRSALRLRVPRALLAAVLAALIGALAMAPVEADTASELKAAQARLHALEDKIAEEQGVVSDLESQASQIAARIDRVQTRIANTQIQIIRLQRALNAATEELQSTQGQLNTRARVAYENGPGLGIEFLLGSTSLANLNSRLEIINRAALSDQALIEKLAVQRVNLDRKRQQMRLLQVNLRTIQATLRVEQEQLEAKLADAQTVVDSLNAHRSEAEHQVSKLEAKRAREIEQVRLARIQAAAAFGAVSGPAGTGPQVIPGVLQVCPVDQPHAYSDDFGAPRSAGGFHLHAGNDILAPMGTPIRAPFSGTASEASNGLGGLSVEVSGSGGYVYNAHLSKIGQLGSVSAGDVVGYVGDSGDARGGPPHDHFEWHPNSFPGSPHVSPYGVSVVNGAIDPFPFLNAVC